MDQNEKGVELLKAQGFSEEQIQEILEKSSAAKKLAAVGGCRTQNKKAIKSFCKKAAVEGRQEISPQEVFEYAKTEFNYQAKDCKGIADAIGSAHGGLFLVMSRKVKSEKFYTIPSPRKFADWYEKDIPLPKEYYGDKYNEFVMREISKPKSTFFDGRE